GETPGSAVSTRDERETAITGGTRWCAEWIYNGQDANRGFGGTGGFGIFGSGGSSGIREDSTRSGVNFGATNYFCSTFFCTRIMIFIHSSEVLLMRRQHFA